MGDAIAASAGDSSSEARCHLLTRLMWVKYEFKTLILFEGLKL